jgi:hypothetical protein
MESNLKGHAIAAGRRILRSLIKMMIKHGVMHREFVELSKEVYIEIASGDYGVRGRPTNVARMALLTGLDRKEVTRIRAKLDTGVNATQPTHKQDRIARVLAGWHQDADYLDEAGHPARIPLDGEKPSFQALVKRYGGDVPAITIMRELQRVNAANVDGNAVQVLRRNYRLDTVDPEALGRSSSVVSDLGRTVTHNLYRPAEEPSRFEARASNVNVSLSALPEYRAFITSEGQEFLERVDAWLTDHEIPEDAAGKEKALRVGLGMYWIQSDASEVTQ